MFRTLRVDESELPTSDIELGFTLDLLSRGKVRHSHTPEWIFLVVVVATATSEGVNGELLPLFAAVYDEIRPK